MKEQILNAKLCMPEFPGIFIKREKLMERMHIIPGKAVVLHAGSGYGKTSAMMEYIRKYQEPYIWYQLDWMDDSTETFLCYFERAIRKYRKDFHFHREGADWGPEVLEDLAKQLLKHLEEWGGRLTIILDDFQYIQNELLYDFLSCFIRFSNPNLRLFLLTKGRFPGFLTKLLLQGQIGVLDKTDLEVSEEELRDCREWPMLYYGENSEEFYNNIEQILYYSQGWMVAVTECMRMQNWSSKPIYSSNMLNYIQYEIWNSLSGKMQDFMRESAALKVMTPEICNAVFEIDNAGAMLEYFVEEQLLTERGKAGDYQYHPLLREFLQKRLGEEERVKIRRREEEFYNNKRKGDRKRVISFSETEKSCSLSCFGSLCVYDEESGRVLHWRTRKAREMFGYFWEQQNHPLTKEEVIEALWQEADGQRIESLFHTTLSYLKRSFNEFGIPNLIHMDNKKYIMDSDRFHSDTEVLQTIYNKWKDGIFSKKLEAEFQKLNQVYTGEYMEEIDSFWTIAKREYYRKLYLSCCKLLVQQVRTAGQQDLAVHILECAIEQDPYSEELNGMLLEVLGALGEFRLAKQCYENYTKILKEDLDINIGRRIQESYQINILRRSG